MPPGSKKRKAAKKKKENQPSHPDSSNNASAQSQGSDDAGEVSSPISDDCRSHGSNPLAVGEEEGIVGTKNDQSPLPEEGVKIEGADETNVAVREVDIVLVERESKDEDDLAKEVGQFNERPDHGGSSGSSRHSRSSSDDESHGTKSHKEAEVIAPVVESVATADSTSGGTNVDVLETISSSAAGNSATPPVKPAYEESEEKKLTSLEDKDQVPVVEKLATYSNPKVYLSQTAEDQLTMSYDAPAAATENGANHGGNLGINEPLLRPVPRQVQTTSWKSCCGLFEVFSGSGR